MKQAVAYFRVSTKRQGQSGLGLEAQQEAVEQFCAREGYAVVRAFTEVESGKNNARPVFAEAKAFAKKTKAIIIIAKLDRLARNLAFVANLMEDGIPFRACDMPEASEFVIHIMAAVAQMEAKSISTRTKAALSVAKAHGTLLGGANPKSRNLTDAARTKAAITNTSKARTAYDDVLPVIRTMRQDGASFDAVARALNAEGHTTRRGKAWNAAQVLRALKYAA